MVIKIELGQRVMGALPKVDGICLAYFGEDYWLGFWKYDNHELYFETIKCGTDEDSYKVKFEHVESWIELPENPKELFSEYSNSSR